MLLQRAVVTLLVLTAVAVPAGVARAASPSPGFVGAMPATGSSTDPSGSFFVLAASPGAVVHQELVVANPGAGSLIASVQGVDATSAVDRGAVYGSPGKAAVGVGAWVVPDSASVTIPAGATRSVGFDVRVPAATAPGQYLGGVSASVKGTSSPASAGQNGLGVDVTMESQRVVAVEVDVAGPRAPQLEVRSGGLAGAGSDRLLVATLANTGNAFAHVTGTVRVPELDITHDFSVRTFLPATTVDVVVPWPADVAEGGYAVSLDATYDGKRLEWSGTVGGTPRSTITSVTAPPASRRPAVARGGTSAWPWLVTAGAGGMVVLGMVLARSGRPRRSPTRGRRRHRSGGRVRPPTPPVSRRSARRVR